MTNLLDRHQEIDTPTFVYDEVAIKHLLDSTDRIRTGGSCKVLFAIKSFSFGPTLALMAPYLDGFATSSLFEARLAR